MLTIVSTALLALAFINPGFGLAFMMLTYSYSAAGALLPAANVIGYTVIPAYWIIRSRPLALKVNVTDIAVLTFFGYRVFSLMWRGPDLTYEATFAAFGSSVVLVTIYIFGRAIAAHHWAQTAPIAWIVGMLALLPIYALAPQQMAGGGTRNVIENTSAVGASAPLGIWVALSFAFIFEILIRNKMTSNRWVRLIATTSALAGASVGLVLLVDNNTRGALIGAIFSCFLLVLFRLTKKNAFVVGAVIVFSMFPAVALADYLGLLDWAKLGNLDRYQSSVVSLLKIFGADIAVGGLDASSQARVVVQSAVLELFAANPIFGCGYGCAEANAGIYPHNIFIEVAADHGLLGLALFAVVLFKPMKSAVSEFEKFKGTGSILAAAFFSFFVQFQFSFAFDTSFVLFAMIGMLRSINLRGLRHECEKTGIGTPGLGTPMSVHQSYPHAMRNHV